MPMQHLDSVCVFVFGAGSSEMSHKILTDIHVSCWLFMFRLNYGMILPLDGDH